MKVSVFGGGSSYTPELVKGFLDRVDTFPLTELWLADISQERLDVVGGFAQRMVAAAGAPFQVVLTTNQRDAIRGASYVTTQLRVGGMPARREDEYLGKRHGLIGQETTGIGGMAKALRTIPVILSIARDMAELAPGAPLVNFTNPSGLVTEALSRYMPEVPAVGVCNVPITTKMRMVEVLERRTGRQLDPVKAELDTLGLNHLSWHRGFTYEGEDFWPEILAGYLAELRADPHPAFEPRLVEILGMMPNYYLSYFYTTDHKLAEQAQWPPSRAEQVMAIEADLLKEYADPSRSQPPDDLMKRGGAYYSTLATQLLNAHFNDLGETHVVNTPPSWRGAGLAGRLGAGDAGARVAGRVHAAARRAAADRLLRAAGRGQGIRAADRRGSRPWRSGRGLPGAARPSAGPAGRQGAGRTGRYAGDEPPASAAVFQGTGGREQEIREQGSGIRDHEPGL